MAYKLLIVDDEQAIVDLLGRFMIKQGFDVVKVSDGREALEYLRSGGPYDLLITDLKMPGVTGFELLREKNRLGQAAPVIVLTGNIDADESAREGELRDAGCAAGDICGKPLELSILLQKIKAKLETYKREAHGEDTDSR